MMKKVRAHHAPSNSELATLRFNGPVRAQTPQGNRGRSELLGGWCARTSRSVTRNVPGYCARLARGQGR